ncbi:hypothetical protein AAFF_G00139100 [Aldrovandia affinis]|uniref:Uncharacterized protein n=1 Tax=Aldrovandia affinis TaxID=143900 RepID=A0AAD7TC22_9TELE|nr:hypothetical protein AAFF_G00139100 [Aldrovandia affinis]
MMMPVTDFLQELTAKSPTVTTVEPLDYNAAIGLQASSNEHRRNGVTSRLLPGAFTFACVTQRSVAFEQTGDVYASKRNSRASPTHAPEVPARDFHSR